MLAACPINLDEENKIKKDLATLIAQTKKEVKQSTQTSPDFQTGLVLKIKEYMPSFYKRNYHRDYKGKFAEIIANATKSIKGTNEFLGNADAILKYLNDIPSKSSENSPTENTNIIETAEDAKRRQNLSLDFLNKMFGNAKALRIKFETKFTKGIVDSFLINREEGTVVTTNQELNENVRKYKLSLFQDITDYLDKSRTAVNPIRQDIRGLEMFKGGKYTGALELIKPEILNNILDKIIGETSDKLIQQDDLLLKAYFAYVMLSNFDSYVKSIFGNNLQILTPGTHQYYKYKFKSKNEKIGDSFLFNSDINIEAEISNVIKLLLNTLELYNWRTKQVYPDSFLGFSKFKHIIRELKKGVFAKKVNDCKFDSNFTKTNIWKKELSDSTKRVLRGNDLKEDRTLAQIINLAKLNSLNYYHAIFELLSNENFYKDYKHVYGVDGFNIDNNLELSFLYSVYKGIFDNKGKSLFAINSNNPKAHNYYSDITNIANSLYKSDLTQYYGDPDTGEIRLRGLIDQGLDDSKRQIENDINIKHSLLSNANPDFSYVNEISPMFKKNTDGENELQSECKITIDIPNTSIRATVGSKTANVYFKDLSTNKNINLSSNLWENENIIKFLDNHLNLSLAETPELLTIIKDNSVTSLNNLVSFACKTILVNYVNKKLNDEYGKDLFKNLKGAASKLFGENNQVLNNLQQINVVGNSELRVLYELSRSQAILSSKMYSGTRRDSENKAVSEEVLNRLFECYQSQVEILERKPDSAVRHLSIINSRLIKGVITAREIKTEDSSKKVISSTPAEKMIISTIYNYFYGLLPEKNTKTTDILKDNLIALTPSVFSDKPVDGMLLTDLNQQINGKILIDASFDDLLNIFPKEFVETYDEIISHVVEDLRALSQFESVKYPLWNLIMKKKWAKNIKTGSTYISPYSAEFYNDINAIAKSLEMDPLDFLNDLVREYNQTSNNPITLITEIHYVPTKQGLIPNDVLGGIADRFRSEYKTREWFKEKEKEMLLSLLSANVSIDLSSDSKVNNLIKTKVGQTWVDESDNLIIAKIKYKDSKGDIIESKISNKTDLDKILLSLGLYGKFNTVYDAINTISEELTFNPELRKLNALDYFISQEFMLVTVGTYAAHKINRNDNSLTLMLKESLLQTAQDKRNNDFTASTYAFDLSVLKGMPTIYNVAVKKDSVAHLYSISKSSHKTTPDDGSTDVNPFVVYLENYSLGQQKVGITKKQFVHFYNPRYATGGDIKTAGFGLTNNLIRKSFRYQNEMKKMTDLPWKNFNDNILKDYDGNPVLYKIDEDGNPIDLYFKEKRKYYKIEDIKYDPKTGLYLRTVTEVEKNGQYKEGAVPETKAFLVNTNYKLWNLLGGAWSMELNNKGYLQPSELSVKSTVEFITSVGIKNPGVTKVSTVDDVYLPLKHSDIHYLCNVGSIKYGAGNINPISDIEGDAPLNYFSIYAISAGVQLDKEHYADNAHLALMTLVISACAAMGFTFERAQNVFEALAQMSNLSSDNIIKKINSSEDLRLIATEILTKSAINSTVEPSFLNLFTEKLAEKFKKGEKLTKDDDIIPFSDNSIFAKAMSTLSVYLTKLGIRLDVPGTLSVISPGYGAMRRYNGKMLDEYDDFDEEIEIAQSKIVPLYIKGVNNDNSVTNIELGATYSILRNGVQTEETIDDPIKYKAIKDLVKLGLIDSITENLRVGRELGTYNIRFKSIDGFSYQLWDLDSIQRSFELDLEIVLAEKLAKSVELDFNNSLLGTETEEEKQEGFNQIVKPYYDILNQKLQEKNLQKVKVQNDLKALSSNYKGVDKRDYVIIDGVAVVINPESKTISNYEIIMPKVFATKFGLDKFDSVQLIKKDKYFFTKKLVEKVSSEIDNNKYELALIKKEGGSVLLSSNNRINTSNLLRLTQIITDDSSTYLYDIDGNVVKYLSSEKDKIYLDPSSGNFVILTDNFEYYLNNEHYVDIRISEKESDENKLNLLNLITESTNNTARKWRESIGEDLKSLYDFGVINWEDENQINQLIETNPRFKFIYEQGNGIYNSWLTSLKVIAARIPCQSMQSFMSMDTVAYEQEDVNNAYVSAMQLWLQGSDLDIDAVSLQTFDINNEGNIELWSPYGNLNDIQGSLDLPFPNGKSTEQIKVEDSNLDFSEDANILVELFSSNGILNLFLTKELDNGIVKITDVKISMRSDSNMNKIKAFLQYYLNKINIPITDNLKNLIVSIFKGSGNSNLASLGIKDIDKIYNKLRKIIDTHNLYLKNPKINTSNKKRMINNFIIHNELEIIEDPVNLYEAQTSVDDSTKEVKDIGNNSKKGQATKQQSSGNIFNKSERLYNTLTGKACVGVCAVGLKTFFAITLYCNYLLRYGTEEELKRLIFTKKVFTYPDGRVVTKNKIANIKPDTIDTVKSAEVKEVLLGFIRNEVGLSELEALANETDAAVILSAFLSLATDNAKELQLSKLNANVRTIGMYVYGLSLGMTFKEVSDIMLSDFMNMAIQLTEGNLFDNDEGYYSFSQVFSYFDVGPVDLLEKFGKLKNRIYNKIKKDEDNGIPKDTKGTAILLKFLENQGNLENIISKLEDYRKDLLKECKNSDKKKEASQKIQVNKLIDFLEKYAVQHDSINLDFYNDVKILAEGAEEFRILGSILALNQGLPTSIDDIRDKIDTIETLISKNERFNLEQFIFDPVYREEQIEAYENKKNTINILDIISKVPHYFSYLSSLAFLNRFGECTAFRYRSIQSILNSPELNGIYNPQINKRISDFVGDLTIKDWLFSKQQLIEISKFNYIEDGEIKSTQDGLIIILGTKKGNRLFKEWMNKVVFKELQEGKNVNSDNVRNNNFIKSLIQTVYTLTFDGNPELVWASKERMLPSNEFELQRFDSIKNDFNQLTSYKYKDYSIGDLLYYYNLIAYRGKLGNQTFQKLFEDKLSMPIIEDFHKFETTRDKSDEVYEIGDFDLNELLMYIAPHLNIHRSNKGYIISLDPDDGKYKLYLKNDEPTDPDQQDVWEKYSEAPISRDNFNIMYKGRYGSVKVSAIDEDGYAKEIKVDGKSIILTSNENEKGELMLETTDKGLIYNQEYIDGLIDTIRKCGK